LSLVGPKARPHGVVDGCQVDIPEPGVDVEYRGTLFRGLSRCWFTAFLQETSGTFGGNEAGEGGVAKSFCRSLHSTVPQTDTGGRVEDTKAFEITLAKELGKMAP
jgi:hypothetical protein